MASGNYLKITDIPGDCTTEAHVDEIELTSWTMGVTVPCGPRTSGGSAAAGTSMHQDVQCMKQVDTSSNALAAACWTGKTIPEAIITVVKQGESGGGMVDYMRITCTDVLVSNYTCEGMESATPTDRFALNYATIKSEYFKTDAAGGSGGWQSKAWSVAEEKEI